MLYAAAFGALNINVADKHISNAIAIASVFLIECRLGRTSGPTLSREEK